MRSNEESTLRSKAHGRNALSVFAHWHRLWRGRDQGGHRRRSRTPSTSEAAAKRTVVPPVGGHSGKISEGKGEGYARWAKRYNLKEMSKTLIFLQENKIGSIEEMQERVNAATARYHELGDSIKAAEQRMAEIAVLRAHIVNYAKTRPVYDAYRKAGYSKKFLEEHREQITLHKAAKVAFDEASLKKLPKVKELDAEYSALLSQKKAAYPAYRKARDEMQELKKDTEECKSCSSPRKKTPRKNRRPAKQKTPRILPILESPRCSFFVIEAFGTNAQPASGGCSTQRVWDYPNKHFATQKWRLYIRTPCLPQQCVLFVRSLKFLNWRKTLCQPWNGSVKIKS